MTDKQENILNAALELFGTDGYASTSTKKIAIKSGVSEGLIFKHFGSKQDLLNTLMREAEVRLGEHYGPVLFETNPKKVIRKAIKLPFKITDKKEQEFRKLQLIQKWQHEYNRPEEMNPVTDKLSTAFKELKYKDPKNEALLLNNIIENISFEILKGNMKLSSTFKDFLLKKYKV